MKQLFLFLSLGLLTGCYNPRPITMTVTHIERFDESEQKEVWGQVGNRVLRAMLVDLPDSIKIGSRIRLLPKHRAPLDSVKGHTFTMIRR